jgi:hypothetical protein
MVRPQQLIESVLYTLQQSNAIPDSTNFVGYTPDINSQSIKLPLIEVSTGIQNQLSESNTDFVGFKTDDSGNDIGRIYETLYTLEITVAIWTAHGSKFSPRNISDAVRDALYAHDTAGPAQPLRHPDGSPVDEVWRFALQDGEQTDDLTTSPTLRRWQQNVVVSASEQYITDEEDPAEAINLNFSQS